MLSHRTDYGRIVVSLIIVSSILSTLFANQAYAASTVVGVDPPTSNVNSGDSFSVNITITDVWNLTGWEFKLFYLRGLLNCSAIVEGPFLKTGGSTTKVFNITNNYNSTHGRVLAGCALLGMNVTVNGTGTAATLTFKALAGGDSPLDLTGTKLSDEKIPPLPIPHTAADGTVHISVVGVHDVAVTNVTSEKKVVGEACINNITVTLENQGGFEENFNVTIRGNATNLQTKDVTLPIGSTVSVTFVWNSAGTPYGNYTLSAYAEPDAYETDTEDNTFTDGRLGVSIPGDLNNDGIVDILDAIILANAFGTFPSDKNWNADADINSDGTVDILDAIILANHFLEVIP